MKRFGWRDLWLAAPALALLVWLDWHGLRSWFHQDDFAWLSLGGRVHSLGDLFAALFRPAAQGTVRVFSERVFFLVLERLFGMDHRPFHLVVLATQAANLALLAWITLRISGSRLAAAAAPVFWTVGPGLAVPLAWLSAYNQILCGFFLLAAFACLLQWLETNRRGWCAAQAALFVLGLGALEIMVVYPVLATAWCWLERRRVPRALWCLWIPSALFTAAHLLLIPKPAAGVYARHWDLSMLATYFQYWKMAFVADAEMAQAARGLLPSVWVGAVSGLAVLGWILVAAWKRMVLPVFGFVWLTVVLAPVLPLRGHVSYYYLALPSIGLAWILAAGLAEARRRGVAATAGALAVVSVFAVHAGNAHRMTAEWRYQRGLEARHLYFALERAAELHPGRVLVLTGIGNELFWTAFFDSRLLFRQRICLDPRMAENIHAPEGFESYSEAICSPNEVAAAAIEGRLTAYRWAERRLIACTRLYRYRLPREWLDAPPLRIDTAGQAATRWLGSGWHQAEAGGRWTSLRVEATLAAPNRAGQELILQGYRPPEPGTAPARITIRLDGAEAARYALAPGQAAFELRVPLPPPTGRPFLRVELEVDRPFVAAGDARQLGLVVSRLEVR
jgi:hypothetical protein